MECKQYKQWMHDYFDDDLDDVRLKELKKHLDMCTGCHAEFHDLKKTHLLLKSEFTVKAPEDFTERIMAQIPEESLWLKMRKWMKGHPVLVAAALFIFFMTGSFASIWNDGQSQFYVSVPNMEQIYVDYKQSKVVVPEGQTINGDLIIRNGDVEIRGKVTGDVIVTDGQVYQASTAHIAGQVEEIDQFVKWIWYHVQKWGKEALQLQP